jgi:hypothetical protein
MSVGAQLSWRRTTQAGGPAMMRVGRRLRVRPFGSESGGREPGRRPERSRSVASMLLLFPHVTELTLVTSGVARLALVASGSSAIIGAPRAQAELPNGSTVGTVCQFRPRTIRLAEQDCGS